MSPTDLQGPARPRRLSATFERSGDLLVLRCSPRAWGAGCFLLLWLIGWTVGCVFLTNQVIREPTLFHILFAIPFWASWIFVVCWLLAMLFRRDELRFDGEGAEFRGTTLLPLRRRRVPLAEIKSVRRFVSSRDDESRQVTEGLELRTLGMPLRFAEGLSGPELDWLEFQINDHLAMLRESSRYRAQEIVPLSSAGTPDAHSDDDKVGLIEVLSTGSSPCLAPSDCDWRRLDGFDDFAFQRRGRLKWGSLMGLLFVNAFWNGIVAVFVSSLFGVAPVQNAPQGAAWWGLCVFLIPFEAIGLLMFAGLLATLLAPVHRNTWAFTRQGIVHRLKWLGLGPSRSWDDVSLCRIELRNDRKPRGWESFPGSAEWFSSLGDQDQRPYRLSMVDNSNTELCSINYLTEGEARWIADALLRERREWFRGA